MKCKHCGEEMIELELYDFGYGMRGVEYECPNECELMKYLEENNVSDILSGK